jgi:hypothetical protein
MTHRTATRERVVEILLRIGVAIAFIYPAVEASFYPNSWVGFFPPWMVENLPFSKEFLLHLFGASEIVIAVWILVGKRIFIPSMLAIVYLSSIVILNWKFMDLLFRDIAILVIPTVLAIQSYPLERPRIAKVATFLQKLSRKK